MTLQTGQMLSHYRLVEQIGKGGMGVVWKAVDTRLDREVAVKVLPPELTGAAESRARPQHGAQDAQRRQHAEEPGLEAREHQGAELAPLGPAGARSQGSDEHAGHELGGGKAAHREQGGQGTSGEALQSRQNIFNVPRFA